MLIAIAFLTFTIIFLVVYALLTTYVPTSGQVQMRLKALDTMTARRSDLDEELAKPFRDRVLAPLTGGMTTALARLTPQAIRHMTEEKLAAAGGFGKMSTDQFLVFVAFLGISIPAVVSMLTGLAGAAVNKVIGLSLISFALALFFPFLLLRRKISARRNNIQKDLPDVLDLLTVSVEAGLGFDGALAKLSEKMKGALVDECTRVLQEIRIGVPRREALHAMGSRCKVDDLSLFTTSLVQADQLGVSIGQVLRVQSASMREKRRQRAQEKAMKAPVKMLIPLVFFIFPAIFVILLGPAMIQLVATFVNK